MKVVENAALCFVNTQIKLCIFYFKFKMHNVRSFFALAIYKKNLKHDKKREKGRNRKEV